MKKKVIAIQCHAERSEASSISRSFAALRMTFALLFAISLFATQLHAESISGKALFDGTPGANPKIDMAADPVCKSMHAQDFFAERIVVNSNQTLKNVFVYIKEGVKEKTAVPASPAVLDQVGCWYVPHVLGMQAGQKLQIVNSDATLHNVHAVAKENKEFNLGMPLRGMKLEKTFSNPEVMIKMKCDVHPWMNAFIGVADHSYFAVTDDQGAFELKNVPPGDYVIEAWHETYGTKTQKVTVSAGAPVGADFKFSASEIVDEASGLKITTSQATPIETFDDSKALDAPKPKPTWWLPENISTFGKPVDDLFYVILWITGIVFVGVQIALLLFLFKYKQKPGVRAHYTHGDDKLEIIWTVIPAIILVVLAFWSQHIWANVKGSIPSGAIPVEIEAEQFAWNVRYAGADGKFNTSDDVKTINQLHIPVGQPVKATLKSIAKDGKHPVIHSFFLPEFRLKQDVVPGMKIDIWFEATRTGKYEIACAEFCGLGHYRMRGALSIHSKEGFDAWLKEMAQGGSV